VENRRLCKRHLTFNTNHSDAPRTLGYGLSDRVSWARLS
jgi:hypothetical protein